MRGRPSLNRRSNETAYQPTGAAPARHYPQAPSRANGGGAQVGQEGLGQDPEEALLIGTKLLKAAFVEKDKSFQLLPTPVQDLIKVPALHPAGPLWCPGQLFC